MRGHAAFFLYWAFICLLALLLFACAKPSLAPNRAIFMHQAINSYLGIPYLYGGSTHYGMDCSGFVMKVYQRAGIELPRTAHEQARLGKKVGIEGLEFGDVLVFKNPKKGGGKQVSHVGLFLGEGRFVHASKSRGVVVDSLNNIYWRERFVEGRRILE